MGKESKDIGSVGEDKACEYLKGLGWEIIERNFRSTHGEVDIIAKDKDTIVFVEVKNYSSRSFYKPVFSITKGKKQCIIHAARTFLYIKQIKDMYCRFDVIAIYRTYGTGEEIEYFKNAFEIN